MDSAYRVVTVQNKTLGINSSKEGKGSYEIENLALSTAIVGVFIVQRLDTALPVARIRCQFCVLPF